MKRLLYKFIYLAIFIWCSTVFAEDISTGYIPAHQDNIETLRMSLDDVLRIAVINNFDIQLAKYDRAIKDADMDDTLSIYDAVLKLSAEYTHDELEKSTTLAGTQSEKYDVDLNLSRIQKVCFLYAIWTEKNRYAYMPMWMKKLRILAK